MKKFTDLTLEQYLNELAGEQPIPGGGSAAAYVAALAMALTQMVGRISLKRKRKSGLAPEEEKKETERRELIRKMIDAVEKTRRDAFQIVNLDPEVYQQVVDAYAHPEKMEDALQNSFRLQADLAFLTVMAREWNANMITLVGGSIKNDLLVSASLLRAAFEAACHTARINVQSMKDPIRKEHAEKALAQLQKRFEKEPAGAGQRG